MNGRAWPSDEGHLTDKDSLPVTNINFGDTGGGHEREYHILGPLIWNSLVKSNKNDLLMRNLSAYVTLCTYL